jgi:hypothetical protein
MKTTIIACRVVWLTWIGPESRCRPSIMRASERTDHRACPTIIYAMRSRLDRTRRMFGAAQLRTDQEQSRVARIIDNFLRAYALAH